MENLTKIPAQITAGDSLRFTVDLADYPAPDWVLSYSLVKSGVQIVFSSTPDGTSHLVSVPAAITALYSPGTYHYQAKAISGSDVGTVERGVVEVLTDFSTQTTGLDARTWLDIAIDALEAAIAGRADKTQLAQKIGGIEVQHMSLAEQLDALDRLKAKRLAMSGKLRKTIRPRFVN